MHTWGPGLDVTPPRRLVCPVNTEDRTGCTVRPKAAYPAETGRPECSGSDFGGTLPEDDGTTRFGVSRSGDSGNVPGSFPHSETKDCGIPVTEKGGVVPTAVGGPASQEEGRIPDGLW